MARGFAQLGWRREQSSVSELAAATDDRINTSCQSFCQVDGDAGTGPKTAVWRPLRAPTVGNTEGEDPIEVEEQKILDMKW